MSKNTEIKDPEVTFKTPPRFLKKFDKFWPEMGYTSRAEAIRDSMRKIMDSRQYPLR